MTTLSLDAARELLAERNPIAVGARGDEERRRRHGTRTTFVRVHEIHIHEFTNSPTPQLSGLPPGAAPGEIRLSGAPPSIEAAVAAVSAVRALAGSIPVTAFSLADLAALAGADPASLTDLGARLAAAGLEAIAEAPIDLLANPIASILAVRDGGVRVPRLVNEKTADASRLALVMLAREIEAEAGGVRAFAPLPRTVPAAQPTTGYDDVKMIAVARLMADNIESIQVDWRLYGPKLAQVALTVGADDVDGVSPLEGDLGRRRSPIEEVRGNIEAAGLDPVERNGFFAPRRH